MLYIQHDRKNIYVVEYLNGAGQYKTDTYSSASFD